MKYIKSRIEFLNETSGNSTGYHGRAHTAATHGAGLDTEYSFGNTHSILPQPKRDFVYYSWNDFINTDFKVFQDIEIDDEENDYGLYKLTIGTEEYVLKPCIVYERGVTSVHLVDLNKGDIHATISEEIPESKDLEKGEFFINPNIPEYESIIEQLIEQGFMTKKEDSSQVIGDKTSDVYKVLGI